MYNYTYCKLLIHNIQYIPLSLAIGYDSKVIMRCVLIYTS